MRTAERVYQLFSPTLFIFRTRRRTDSKFSVSRNRDGLRGKDISGVVGRNSH